MIIDVVLLVGLVLFFGAVLLWAVGRKHKNNHDKPDYE